MCNSRTRLAGVTLVELIMAFEETFRIEVPEDAAEKIITVQDAIDYIVAAKKVA